MLCNSKIFKFINKNNVSFNTYFNDKRISEKISAAKIDNKYLSVSDKVRLTETRKFFKKKYNTN